MLMMNRIARGLSILCLAASLVSAAREAAADCVGDIQTLTLSTGETVGVCTPYRLPFEFCPTCPESFVKIVFDPGDPNTIYLPSSPNGLFKSVDGGLNWSAMIEGLSDTGVRALLIDPVAPSTLYLGLQSGTLFSSFDAGLSWIHPEPKFGQIMALAVDATSGPLASTLYVASDGGGIFEKHGDQPCVPMNDGLTNFRARTIAVNPLADTRDPRLYAGIADAGIWGYNAAITPPQWMPMNVGLDSLRVSSLIATRNTAGALLLLAGTEDRGVYASGDGGRSWHVSSRGLNDRSISVLAADPPSVGRNLYAGTRSGEVYRSSDLGLSWVQLNPSFTSNGAVVSITADPVAAQTLYVGAVGGIFEIMP